MSNPPSKNDSHWDVDSGKKRKIYRVFHYEKAPITNLHKALFAFKQMSSGNFLIVKDSSQEKAGLILTSDQFCEWLNTAREYCDENEITIERKIERNNLNLGLDLIPFLEISSPPNIYNLKRAREAAEKKYSKNGNKTFIRWDVEKVEREELLRSFSCFNTTYVSVGTLEKKINSDRENNLVFTTSPALCELGNDKDKLKNFAGAPQFSFGKYVYGDKLFLIEDIYRWSHNQISWSEIRTAKSIIESEKLKCKRK